MDTLRAQIRYALNPPEQEIFVPEELQAWMETIAKATLQILTPQIQFHYPRKAY